MFEKEKEVVWLSVSQALKKSKIVLTQYVAIGSAAIAQYGQPLIDTINSNQEHIQLILDPKYFGAISILCGILTIYLKFTTKSLVGKEAQ